MSTNQLLQDLPLFAMRIAVISFFSIGFIQYFQRIWSDAFEREGTSTRYRFGRRLILLFLSVGLGCFIHFGAMAYITNDSALLYHNWALFVLVLPLLYGGFNGLEVSLQSLTLLMIWYMHHAPNFWHPTTLLALAGFIALAVLLKRYHQYIMQHWWVGVLLAGILASLFWFTVPHVSMHLVMTTELKWEAVLMYTLMIAFVLGYWLRQYRDDKRTHELERLAEYEKGTYDTGYANHQAELQQLFTKTQTQNDTLTFATLDLDHFKQINDRFGRLAGNAVLIAVGETLKQLLTNANVEHQLYLTTGEEYNIVFPNQSAESVLPIIKGCWQAIRKQEFPYKQRNIAVTVSIGCTALQSDDTSINDIYKRADDALSKSKRSGRDTVTFDTQIISGADKSEKSLADYCYFSQGIYDITQDDHPKYYHELLLRTYDSLQKRWVLPDTFEIPAWMQIALLQEFMRHTQLHNFNINLTADQFQDIDIAEALAQFSESPEGPTNLTVEITALTDSQTTRRISARYRAAGIKILIDDVGSDNSFEMVRPSMAYINGFKFAMQNLRKTTSDSALRERVQFWRQIAKENQLSFILEGVETAEDLKMAQALSTPYVQGYYFDKPSAAEGLSQ